MSLQREAADKAKIMTRAPALDAEFRECLTPVLLEFGTTVFHCQIFEDNLCYLLALISEDRTPSEGHAFQASWEFHSRKTLGRLVDALGKLIPIQDDLEEFLFVGVENRNTIVHGFLTKNMLKLIDPKGRLDLIDELVRLRADIDARDRVIEAMVVTYIEKYGLKRPDLLGAVQRLWRIANPNRSSDDPNLLH